MKCDNCPAAWADKEAIEFFKNLIEQDNRILEKYPHIVSLKRDNEAYELAIKALERCDKIKNN